MENGLEGSKSRSRKNWEVAGGILAGGNNLKQGRSTEDREERADRLREFLAGLNKWMEKWGKFFFFFLITFIFLSFFFNLQLYWDIIDTQHCIHLKMHGITIWLTHIMKHHNKFSEYRSPHANKNLNRKESFN